MDQACAQKNGNGTCDGTPVDSLEFSLDIVSRKWRRGVVESTQNKIPDGRRPDAIVHHSLFEVIYYSIIHI